MGHTVVMLRPFHGYHFPDATLRALSESKREKSLWPTRLSVHTAGFCTGKLQSKRAVDDRDITEQMQKASMSLTTSACFDKARDTEFAVPKEARTLFPVGKISTEGKSERFLKYRYPWRETKQTGLQIRQSRQVICLPMSVQHET